MKQSVISQLYLKDTAFQKLMQKRIVNVLLIASPYDAFMMEEDGRVEVQLFFEYMALNLSLPPRVTIVSNMKSAVDTMQQKKFDLVIAMPGVDISETFDGAKEIKSVDADIPFVVLTPFSKEVSRRIADQDMSNIDFVFSWLGNVDLLLAIIKLIEDTMNAEEDVLGVGVQMILLVEDSVRFYSSVLPHLFKFLLNQSLIFSTEALNEHEKMLRMRGRPKVMLARNYEEAVEIYEKYHKNILGVISDVTFMHEGEKDPKAGIKLAHYLRDRDPYLPIIVESSESENRELVKDFGGVFLDKNSKKLPVDLGKAITDNFGFGDFIIRNPETQEEILRIKNLKELQKRIFEIPDESLLYHARRNDISRWLYSRAMFPIAEVLKEHRTKDNSDVPSLKSLVFDLIVKYRKMKNRGVVAEFQKDRFDHYSNFARIGQGSMGGKGRGLAFIDTIIKRHPDCDNFMGVGICIPRTVVICTDIFDQFMADNNLYPFALEDHKDEEILQKFLAARLPEKLRDDLLGLYDVIDGPLAVRSSSLLEDSHYQPFAGIYSTYMIPHADSAESELDLLTKAIKSVYASVFYSDSKAYMTATSNVIDQEKMAVIIQEVVGRDNNGYFFPSFSGVGRSLNYYPINDEKAEEGVAQIAVGLGKYIVDGGRSLRFSPAHPNNVLQTSTLDLALKDTQIHFNAIKTSDIPQQFSIDDGFNIVKIRVQNFANTGVLRYMVSTYDPTNDMMVDYELGEWRRVVTFNNMLRDNVFPLAETINYMLKLGQQEMCRPVEIELAGIVYDKPDANGMLGKIYWLQIRPIIDKQDMIDDDIMEVDDNCILLKSNTALGHGKIEDVDTIIYVRPQNFRSSNNTAIAREIEKINREFLNKGRGYILVGPGRWGSSDTALGIPVKWPMISAARLIVESSLAAYRIEPSQGTHFFQNLTSFGVGYFTINPSIGDGIYDCTYLDNLDAEYESDLLRIVKFNTPLSISINGKKGVGIVLKPEDSDNRPLIANN